MTVIINGLEYVPAIKLRITDKSLGELLKQCRKAAKLSMGKAATAIGCSKSTLHDLEHDRAEPGLRMARNIAEAYGVPIATLAAALDGKRERFLDDVDGDALPHRNQQ